MMCLACSRPALVIFASPGAQPPSRQHSSRTVGPAALWIAPSTPPPPNSPAFAAVTIASALVSSVIVAAGDGTINEAAEGILHSSLHLPILPGGTANVLANEIGLGTRIERAAARLEECRPRRISVGHLTSDGGRVSRHFLLMAGIGFDAYVVHHVDGELKSRTGKFAYWVAGMRLLGRRLEEFHADIGGEKRPCSFALVSKGRNYGGDFEMARSVRLSDDQFEVVLFEARPMARYLSHFAGMM